MQNVFYVLITMSSIFRSNRHNVIECCWGFNYLRSMCFRRRRTLVLDMAWKDPHAHLFFLNKQKQKTSDLYSPWSYNNKSCFPASMSSLWTSRFRLIDRWSLKTQSILRSGDQKFIVPYVYITCQYSQQNDNHRSSHPSRQFVCSFHFIYNC